MKQLSLQKFERGPHVLIWNSSSKIYTFEYEQGSSLLGWIPSILGVFEKQPFRRACRWLLLLFSCSRVENKVFVLLFSLAFKSSQFTFTHGKILPWQQRCACRRATFPGNGSVKRGSLLLCMKGAGNKNMHECSAQLANLSQPNTGAPSQAPRNPITNAKIPFIAL